MEKEILKNLVEKFKALKEANEDYRTWRDTALADAEACLQALQQDSDEDIRKAAFRALRRSQRLRAKAQSGTGTGAQA